MATNNISADKTSLSLQKGKLSSEQKESDNKRVNTVTPDNDNGTPGAPAARDSSNKGKGPAGENL